MKIKYEPHPVTPERKAELRDQGYKIIDARFAPASEAAPVPQSPEDIDGMGKKDVSELLKAHGDDGKGSVGELRERLKAVMFVGL